MGDLRQYKLIRNHISNPPTRALEVGSRNYGNKMDIRALFPDSLYVGVDLTPGPDVDVVSDLCKGSPFPNGTFDWIICCSVLEHTPAPWLMAEIITNMLSKGGVLYVSVPWIFPYHGYPVDYFRFSPAGVKALFPGIRWTKIGRHSGPTGLYIEWNDAKPNEHLAVRATIPDGQRDEVVFRKCLVDMFGVKC